MEHEQIWHTWANHLRRWRLIDFAAWFLDSLSPIHLVSAQLLYMGEPFLQPFIPNRQFNALATLLETPDQAQAFAMFLREEH